jgi:peptidoglycan/LPS O-acetylase OafA/YrhL
MGQVSFSAYLLHFAVIHFTVECFPALFHVYATGMRAIGAFAATWVVMVVVTFGLSMLTYRLIELPMMEVGKKLARRTALAKA